MNSFQDNNDIHTNLPTLSDIKSWKIKNIKHIPQWTKQNNENINVRMQINKKAIYKALYFHDYIDDGKLNESRIILEACRLKEQLEQYKNRTNQILQEEALNNWLRKIKWLWIKMYKWTIMFYFRLNNWFESNATSLFIEEWDFEQTFYKAIDKFLGIKKDLWYDSIDVDDKFELYRHIWFYRNKYGLLLKDKKFEEEKSKLIMSNLITEEWYILWIKILKNSLIYKSNIDGRKITRSNNEKNILELIEKFVLHNWIELNWDIHQWLNSKKIMYSEYYQKKLQNKK